MGGHGALTIALRNPEIVRSVSAFSPIYAPTECPWGRKALTGYLGDEHGAWLAYDSTHLLSRRGWRGPEILIDQGEADQFLESQLKPWLLERAAEESGSPLRLRMHAGYDHSYYFIASYIADHLEHHARYLKGL
jgi:S-formylglutathione hydrolase